MSNMWTLGTCHVSKNAYNINKSTSFAILNRATPPNLAFSFLNTILYHFTDEIVPPGVVCLEHDHELLKPQLFGTWMPNGVGAMAGHRNIFAETQVR